MGNLYEINIDFVDIDMLMEGWPTLTDVRPGILSTAIIIFSTGLMSQGLGSVPGSLRKNASNWVKMLAQEGEDVSKAT